MGIYRKKVDLSEISTASEAIGIETAHTLTNLQSPFFKAFGTMAMAYLTYERTEQDEVDLDNAQTALAEEQAFDPMAYIASEMGKAENQDERMALLQGLGDLQEGHKNDLADLQERVASFEFLPAHSALNAMESALLQGKRKNGSPTTEKDLDNKVLKIPFARKGFFFRLAIVSKDNWYLYLADNAARTAVPCMSSTDLLNGSEVGSMSKAHKVAAAWINYQGANGKSGVRDGFATKFSKFNQGSVVGMDVCAMPASTWIAQAELGELPE